MCRNIKQLRRSEQAPTDKENRDAALQFVRKVSGYRKPSKANQVVFDQAIEQISQATRILLDNLITR